MTTWTHVGTTTGVWDNRVGPAGTIIFTSHASTQNGDLVMVHLAGHDSTGVPTLTGQGFTHSAGAGNTGTFYRSDVTGATSWDAWNFQSRGLMWVCQTLRPGGGGINPTVTFVAAVSIDGAPEDYSNSDLLVARMGISGYALEADAIADDLNVTGDDPNYQQLHSKVEDSVVHQLGPTRYCETYLQSFTLLDSSLRNGAVSWTRTDTGAPLSPSITTPTASQKYRLSYTAASPPSGTLSPLPTTGAIPLDVTVNVSAEDGDIAVASWELDYGDGSPTETGTGPLAGTDFFHTYETVDVFTVTFTITPVSGSDLVLEDFITTTEHIPLDTEEGGGNVYLKRHVTAKALPYHLNTGMLQGVPRGKGRR